MRKVAILAHSEGAFFETGCAIELFALPRPDYPHWYKTDLVSLCKERCRLTSGVGVLAKKISTLDRYDMLVIPSWPNKGKKAPAIVGDQIKKFHGRGKRIITFCSGAFLLAELGLLDGQDATTHWKYASLFKQRYPKTNYVEDVLYIYDGTIGCSAGSAAALDLGIEIIRQDYGHKIANQVARSLVLSSHRQGGQSQFVENPVLTTPGQFSNTLDWAVKNLHTEISVDALANKAHMSRRTFDRKFRATLNLTPTVWLVQQRLQLAKTLLENRNLSIENVALKSGFNNSTTMRHHFRKAVGISPTQFQLQFGTAQHTICSIQNSSET